MQATLSTALHDAMITGLDEIKAVDGVRVLVVFDRWLGQCLEEQNGSDGRQGQQRKYSRLYYWTGAVNRG